MEPLHLVLNSLAAIHRDLVRLVMLPFESLGERELDDRIRCPGLPLAVYREIAAHLCQVDGLTVELVTQQSPQFDYRLSQVDSLWLKSMADADSIDSEQVRRILAYYSDRYGAWEAVKDNTWV